MCAGRLESRPAFQKNFPKKIDPKSLSQKKFFHPLNLKKMKSLFQICFLVGIMPLFLNFTTLEQPELTKKGPLITATVSTQLYCKVGKTCGTWQNGFKRWHGFKLTLTGASISFYNSNFSYSIYPNATGTGNPIATFPCTQNVVEFAGSQLANSTTYSVVIKHNNSSNAGMVVFTTGTGAGSNCVVGPVQLGNDVPIKL